MCTRSAALRARCLATLAARRSCSLVTMLAEAPLPPEAADALRPVLPRLADDIVAAIAAEGPGYTRPMEGRFGQVVRFGVQVALNRFIDLLVSEDAEDATARDTYVRLGAGEYHAGR